MFIDKIKNRQSNIIVYGITPPKKSTDIEKTAEISAKQVARLKDLDLDGLVLYDIQDETSRTSVNRPFPFMATLDAFDYAENHLSQLNMVKIIYRAVGKYSEQQLTDFLTKTQKQQHATVFVGAASKGQKVTLSMQQAYELKTRINPDLLIGGVTIPERHQTKGDEHIRVFDKIKQGCNFFVSQGVYDVNASKNFLSDYYYYGQKHNIPLAPILFTLTPCGSPKTLEFMKWLGISIPKWLENELIHSHDILKQSVDYSEQAYLELKAFADQKNIPIGCNIESVATRKVEIDASIDLVNRIKRHG
jgi:5,10-methylenetetrahydrofolate reductase